MCNPTGKESDYAGHNKYPIARGSSRDIVNRDSIGDFTLTKGI